MMSYIIELYHDGMYPLAPKIMAMLCDCISNW